MPYPHGAAYSHNEIGLLTTILIKMFRFLNRFDPNQNKISFAHFLICIPITYNFKSRTVVDHCLRFANSGGGSPLNGFHLLILFASIPFARITARSPKRFRI